MKLKKLAAGLGMALAFTCGTAQAQVIRGQDDNIEFLLTSSLQPKTTGTFAEGDVLVSIYEFTGLTLDGTSLIPAGSEATGITVLQIADITELGGGLQLITFQPYTGGFNAVSPVDIDGGNAGEGAMIGLWINDTTFNLNLDFATNPETNCTSFAQCLAEASAGTLVQVDGFFGDADNFWTAVTTVPGGNDVETVAGTEGSTGVAQFNAALTTFFNTLGGGDIGFKVIGPGTPCPTGTTAADGCIAGPTLTGPALGGAGLNPDLYAEGAFARSDFDASKLLAVPEPGVLLLLGIGLLGLAATRRRRPV